MYLQIESMPDRAFDNLIFVFKYDGDIRRKIIDYKFKEKSYLYKMFSSYLLKNEQIMHKLDEYDAIIPVPISRNRAKERGYNQSLLIAKEIGRVANKKVLKKVLIKNRNIVAQSTLNKEDRLNNVHGAFSAVNTDFLQGLNVLLVDDVFTTGSTANECAGVLLDAGASSVDVFVLAYNM